MVDFFAGYCSDGSASDDKTDAPEFGICDDAPEKGVPRKRAYIDHNTPAKWIAKVLNQPRYQITFIGIDHCLNILKGNGKLQSRCDGALLYDKYITFIELKSMNDDSMKWVNESAKQVKQSIKDFRKSHPDNTLAIEAYLVNSQRPASQQSHSNFINRFFKDTKIVLHIEAIIDIEALTELDSLL